MKILITQESYLVESQEVPIVGKSYILEDADEYTGKQRRTWEALVDEAFRSGKFSHDTVDIHKFREHIKLDYGEGFDRLKYVNDRYQMVEVKSQSEIPDYVALDFGSGNRERIQGIIKSTTAYTKKQFIRMIDNTIKAMLDHEVDSVKFHDILDGLDDKELQSFRR